MYYTSRYTLFTFQYSNISFLRNQKQFLNSPVIKPSKTGWLFPSGVGYKQKHETSKI